MEKAKISEVLTKLKSYWDVYAILAKGAVSKEQLVEALKTSTKLSPSSISEKCGAVFNAKKPLPLTVLNEDKVQLNDVEVMEFMYVVMECLGVVMPEGKEVARKKPRPEDAVPKVMTASSPQFKKLQKENNELRAQIRVLQAKNLQDTGADILSSMEKVVRVEPMYSEPREVLERDFFLQNPVRGLDVDYLMECYHADPDVIYRVIPDEGRELTVENYRGKIHRILFGGNLLKKKYLEQERLILEQEQSEQWKEREEISGKEIYGNQLTSINELLEDKSISNQVKLSVYAASREPKGSEMEELLNFAGDNGIDAEYVIRLLENPTHHSYRIMRNFLRQAYKGSEARIKREAARELIAGEWYVIAEYDGKPCQFRMLPVDELLTFQKLLKEKLYGEALATLTATLEKKRSAVFKDKTPNSEMVVCDTGIEAPVPIEAQCNIPKPDFIKEREQDSGVNCHEVIDEDDAYDAYSESEVHEDGEE